MYVSVMGMFKHIIKFPKDVVPLSLFSHISLFYFLSNRFGVFSVIAPLVSSLLFPFSSTSTPLSLPLPAKCLGSISIIRSPLVWRAAMYCYWGCDCLKTGSRLLDLTGSVCSSGWVAALRQSFFFIPHKISVSKILLLAGSTGLIILFFNAMCLVNVCEPWAAWNVRCITFSCYSSHYSSCFVPVT